MDRKVFKYVGVGFGIYALFALSVLFFYEDDPDQMSWEERQAFNKRFIANLSELQDKSKTFIIDKLGSPDITEAKKRNSDTYQVMFYRTQHKKSDGITTKEECTPILFKNGQLIAWGESAYNQFNES